MNEHEKAKKAGEALRINIIAGLDELAQGLEAANDRILELQKTAANLETEMSILKRAMGSLLEERRSSKARKTPPTQEQVVALMEQTGDSYEECKENLMGGV